MTSVHISFIGQGLSEEGNSVGKTLRHSFYDSDYDSFSCIVAFASPSGIESIKDELLHFRGHGGKFKTIVGVDQKQTSKKALELLLSLNINTKIYYTTSNIIFHPKIYLFNGSTKTRIILGSSNMTRAGLFQNVEASVIVEFTKPDPEGEELLNEIHQYFKNLFESEESNIRTLTQELIETFSTADIIPGEEYEAMNKETILNEKARENNSVIEKIRTLFPTLHIQKIPQRFVPNVQVLPLPQPSQTAKGRWLWSKILTDSDALRTKPGTNPTGKISLTQGLKGGINQTIYFRNNIFGNFTWTITRGPSTESTQVKFHITLLGVDKGIHTLTLRHNPKLEAGQHNFTTSISWGSVSNDIKATNLSGRKLDLYGPVQGQTEPYYIEII